VGCGVSTNEYSCAHGAQINFGVLTPDLTCGTHTAEREGTDRAVKLVHRIPTLLRYYVTPDGT
jgi:hypothetical protein